MKLINELLKLTMLITCNKTSEELSFQWRIINEYDTFLSSSGKATDLEPQGLAAGSRSSSATVSKAVLTKSLSPSFYKMIDWRKEYNVLSQSVKSRGASAIGNGVIIVPALRRK